MPFADTTVRALGVLFQTLAIILWALIALSAPSVAEPVPPIFAAPPGSPGTISPTSAAAVSPTSAGPIPSPPATPIPSISAAPASALPTSAASAGNGTTHYDELLVSVALNGTSVSENTMILKDERGVYYANADDVRAWNVIQTGRRSIEYNGQHYLALDDFKASLDVNRGLLSFTASPTVFGLNVVNFQHATHAPPNPTHESGGFLNYDIARHFGAQSGGISGSFNGADTLLGGVVTASAAQPGNGSGFVLLNTAFEHDNLPRHTVLRFGDAVEAGGILPQQRQFAGVQWGTDFTLQPSFRTTALPAFSGTLPTDGTLDVIVNGRQVSQQEIPAGPFLLQNLPVDSGSGNVTLVLRDASGHVQTIVSPYYQSPVLLRQGVSQFEIDSGIERQGYGIVSNSYDGTFVSAQGRRGVSNRLTLGGAIDGSAHTQSGSVAADLLLPGIGQVAATFTRRSGLGPGLQQTYTYGYQAQRFGLGAQLIKSSPLYGNTECQLACTATNPSYQLVGNASVSAGKSASLALSYGHSITSDGVSSRTTDLTYGRRLGPGNLNINLLHSGPFPATTLITATYSFTMQIGARGHAGLTAVRGKGESGQTVTYDQSLPNDSSTGIAYQLQAQTLENVAPTFGASATEQLAKATVSQQVFHGQDTTIVSADVAGSIDFVDGAVGLARTVGQGFGVVELPGYPGVRVYSNGQEVGRTDARGRLILNQLQPYQANEITVEGEDLPIGVDLGASVAEIVPYRLSPGIARFGVKAGGGVSLTLVDPQGAVLPAGTKIVAANGNLRWIVALDGMAYLDSVAAGKQRFTATTSTGTCSFELTIPKDTTQLPDLGRTVCR